MITEIAANSLCEYLSVISDIRENTPIFFRGVCDNKSQLAPKLFRIINNHNMYGPKSEKHILLAFKQEAAKYIPDINDYNLCKLAEIAQHYGVPTRFLDWTTNPLISLYFATESSNTDGYIAVLKNKEYIKNIWSKERRDDQKITIAERISHTIDERQSFISPCIYQPYFWNERMSVQKSLFLVWGSCEKSLEEIVDEADEGGKKNKW